MDCIIVYVNGHDEKKDRPIFVKVEDFKVSSHEEAAKYVEEYNSKHTDRKYYYKPNDGIYIHNSDGTTTRKDGFFDRYDEVEGIMRSKLSSLKDEWRQLKKESRRGDTSERIHQVVRDVAKVRKFYSNPMVKFTLKTFIWIKDNFTYYAWSKWMDKIHDINFEHRRMNYFKNHRHDIIEPWSLDWHMLRDLRWNLKRLKEEAHGFPTEFLIEALKEIHKDDPSFDESRYYNFTSEESDALALKKCHETYDRIIHEIDLYWFYSDGACEGDDYEKTEDMVNHYFKGTYDTIDYKKHSEIAQSHWNEIWRLFAKYGQGMWD